MDNSEVTENKQALGIGGLLILVAIGICLTPFKMIFVLVTTYPPIFEDGTWEALTSVESDVYSAFWAPLLLAEIFVNLVILIIGFYLIYLFFMKKKLLPVWYFGAALFSACFIALDSYVVSLLLPEIEVFDKETVKELIGSIFALCIWSPYLFYSQRAKDTFVNPGY